MEITSLVEQGLKLMVLGMGMVFLILGLLVIVIKVTSALIMKYQPAATNHSPKVISSGKIHDDIVDVIAIAIKRYRSK